MYLESEPDYMTCNVTSSTHILLSTQSHRSLDHPVQPAMRPPCTCPCTYLQATPLVFVPSRFLSLFFLCSSSRRALTSPRALISTWLFVRPSARPSSIFVRLAYATVHCSEIATFAGLLPKPRLSHPGFNAFALFLFLFVPSTFLLCDIAILTSSI